MREWVFYGMPVSGVASIEPQGPDGRAGSLRTMAGIMVMERFFLLSVVALLVSSAAAADTFKYQDQDGVIHYSDRPFHPGHKSLEQEAQQWYHQDKSVGTIPRKTLLGSWTLYGITLNADDPLTPDDDLWIFEDDGGFTTRGLQSFNIRAGFRLRGDILETNEMGQWLPYRIVFLSADKLVLENQAAGGYYHFRRADDRPDPVATGQIYRRKTYARLATLASCIQARHKELSHQGRTRLLLEWVRQQGIQDFDLAKFQASARYYKTDRDFVIHHQPEVTRRAFECAVQQDPLQD